MSSGDFASMQKHEISSFNFSLNWTERVVNCVFRKVKRTKEDVTLERQDPFCGLFDQAAEHSWGIKPWLLMPALSRMLVTSPSFLPEPDKPPKVLSLSSHQVKRPWILDVLYFTILHKGSAWQIMKMSTISIINHKRKHFLTETELGHGDIKMPNEGVDP